MLDTVLGTLIVSEPPAYGLLVLLGILSIQAMLRSDLCDRFFGVSSQCKQKGSFCKKRGGKQAITIKIMTSAMHNTSLLHKK
jgi:hypothetical protein